MASARVFGAIAGRAFMAAASKSSAKKKPVPSGGAAAKAAVKKPAAPRTTNSGIQKVVPVSSELGDFLGAPQVSRTDAVKKVWAYIKLQNLQFNCELLIAISIIVGFFSFYAGIFLLAILLQNPANKKEIFCDEKLKTIFEGKDKVGFTEIAKLLSSHFVKSG
ncbi:hypothetical protein JHK84_030701 [Glycine max]|nr:hypothetical protein JHK84_030701 [Glycine max]